MKSTLFSKWHRHEDSFRLYGWLATMLAASFILLNTQNKHAYHFCSLSPRTRQWTRSRTLSSCFKNRKCQNGDFRSVLTLAYSFNRNIEETEPRLQSPTGKSCSVSEADELKQERRRHLTVEKTHCACGLCYLIHVL